MASPNMPVHKRVREIALAFAHEVFESWLTNEKLDLWRQRFPELKGAGIEKLRAVFVAHTWPAFVDQAKNTMADLLTSPTLTDKQKDEIAEALILDNSLGRGKVKTAIAPDIVERTS